MEKVNAYLQITMKIKENDRPSAAKYMFFQTQIITTLLQPLKPRSLQV